jgi:CelD/BcsL family acetyltransferase involved in cellulose biosynthesis
MREHAVPPRAFRFFRALWHRLRPPGVLRLLLAEQGARLIAGSIFLSLASTVHYAFNGSRREDFALRPNDAILWQAIHDAADEGRGRFDLGEVVGDQSGLAEFKSKWGAEEVPLWRYYHPAPRPDGATGPAAGRLIGLAEATWRRLPLPVTAVVGDYLYRRL